MAIWREPVLTDRAKQAIVQDLLGKSEIVFTRIEYGIGKFDEGENLAPRTSLREKKQSFPISSAQIENNYLRIRAVATNQEVTEPYEIWEVGVFAKIKGKETEEEILFSIAAAEKADTFPAYGGNKPCEILQEYYIFVDADIQVSVEGISAFVNVKDFEEYQEQVKNRFENLPRVVIGTEDLLNRKDTNRVVGISERNSSNERKDYQLASVFTTPETRSALASGDTIDDLMGKINRYLLDLKPVAYKDGDDPFVLMTETTYKPPSARQKGSLYGMVTKLRNLIILFCSRYVQGLEDPRQAMTIYGVETSLQTENTKSDSPAKAILDNFVQLPETGQIQREQYMLYGRITKQKGA